MVLSGKKSGRIPLDARLITHVCFRAFASRDGPVDDVCESLPKGSDCLLRDVQELRGLIQECIPPPAITTTVFDVAPRFVLRQTIKWPESHFHARLLQTCK